MSIFRSEFREVEIDYFDQKYKLYIYKMLKRFQLIVNIVTNKKHSLILM